MISDRQTPRAIEEWSGHLHSEPPKRMKLQTLLFVLLSAALAIFALTGCTQTTTRTVDPVTGATTETTTKAPSPGVLPFAGDVIRAYSPRPIYRVREEKSGRITAREIRERWQPAHGPALP